MSKRDCIQQPSLQNRLLKSDTESSVIYDLSSIVEWLHAIKLSLIALKHAEDISVAHHVYIVYVVLVDSDSHRVW